MRRRNKDNINGLIFASPWLIGFIVFTVVPIILSLYYSFTNFNIFQKPSFVGLNNYIQLFQDDNFYKSMLNTGYITIIGVPLNIIFGLLMAMLLNSKVKGQSIFRTIYFIPSIVPIVACSILWMWIYNAKNGLINVILDKLNLYQPGWLVDPKFTKVSLLIIGIWACGMTMVVFLAALQDVPKSLYEAAKIDGANRIHKFFYITLPVISPVIFFQVIIGIIAALQYFTQAYVMLSTDSYTLASGGPENSMLFYAISIFYNAFQYLEMGKASAMAWILFIVSTIITLCVFKSSKKWVFYGGGD
ncbi:spermidine/putrescine ABC transporter permease [Vallitalea longa]|uniref:Spermidine/putrescine ABC transporter permease n=1 Tax=Vallitalea longa TaxID=2936439 RepID=A0A9W6DEA4_9FIRM|nr:sugar ABC transporter permease [Vallitalea longa]GKX29956.1 spermidine/putrescine ABC transporter permease [Vallitalea longa]